MEGIMTLLSEWLPQLYLLVSLRGAEVCVGAPLVTVLYRVAGAASLQADVYLAMTDARLVVVVSLGTIIAHS
jgi:hypothetical protein